MKSGIQSQSCYDSGGLYQRADPRTLTAAMTGEDYTHALFRTTITIRRLASYRKFECLCWHAVALARHRLIEGSSRRVAQG